MPDTDDDYADWLRTQASADDDRAPPLTDEQAARLQAMAKGMADARAALQAGDPGSYQVAMGHGGVPVPTSSSPPPPPPPVVSLPGDQGPAPTPAPPPPPPPAPPPTAAATPPAPDQATPPAPVTPPPAPPTAAATPPAPDEPLPTPPVPPETPPTPAPAAATSGAQAEGKPPAPAPVPDTSTATPPPAPSGATQAEKDAAAIQQGRDQANQPMNADRIFNAILGTEGSGANAVSRAGAHGRAQIMPGTFDQYKQGDEDYNSEADRMTVARRLVGILWDKYHDPAKVAVAYFSGEGNVNTDPNSTTPWKNMVSDKISTVAQYVDKFNRNLGVSSQYAGPGAGGGTTGGGTTGGDPYTGQYAQSNTLLQRFLDMQPQIWDKLSQLQADYQAASKRSPWDNVQDDFTKWMLAQNAANANLNATPGGVYWRALPDPDPFNRALVQGHAIDQAQRQHDWDVSANVYNQGANLLAKQLQGAYQAVGLSQTQAKDVVDAQLRNKQLGIEEQGVQERLAQLKQTQDQQFTEYTKNAVPNDDTRAALNVQAQAIPGWSSMTYEQKQAAYAGLVDKARQNQQLIGKPESIQMRWYDPKTDTVETQTFDKQRDADKITQLQRDFHAAAVPATSPVQVNMPGSQGAGEKGAATGGAGELERAADAAPSTLTTTSQLRDVIKEMQARGLTTGPLSTDPTNPTYKLRQLAASFHIIPSSDQALTELYTKLLGQIQLDDILPKGANFARFTQGEMQVLRNSTIGTDYRPEAVATFLDHIDAVAKYSMDKAQYLHKKEMVANAQQQPFNFGYEARAYDQAHMKDGSYPTWNMSQFAQDRLAREKQQQGGGSTGAGNTANAPQVDEVRPLGNGRYGRWDGKQWQPVVVNPATAQNNPAAG